ncbi:hypothetical protein JGH11_12720 [Dysgonomonas sp. Marseille-P4677]|uniref:hypothetical protein n=1 Tax=Dysgonomonas sp. Marseille-P4677 TaxID=2364790 RepID=UPI0019131CA3|nr:hypothetical protein [Dysgonomonas sp. Marseille-P4677]MBK5721735.1 hypothetical protein [Dysgonomonas sp. Marseille-P4677]
MSIYCNNECLNCIHYFDDEKEIVNKIQFKKGEFWKLKPKEYEIVFILKGSLNVSFEQYSNETIEKDDMILIPSDRDFYIEAMEDSELFLMQIPASVLTYQCTTIKLFNYQTPDTDTTLNYLTINKNIAIFLSTLEIYIEENIKCFSLHECKIRELFFLLEEGYKKTELYKFFHLALKNNSSFSNLANHNKTK